MSKKTKRILENTGLVLITPLLLLIATTNFEPEIKTLPTWILIGILSVIALVIWVVDERRENHQEDVEQQKESR
jgi:positive regulator of sigma E activity